MRTMLRLRRVLFFAILAAVASGDAPSPAIAEQESLHPLQIHMQQWLRGSGKWRTPNPEFDPEYSGPPATESIKEFGVNWKWEPAQKAMLGELTGVFADGSEVRMWAMYMFFNPATEQIIFQQTGRNGAYITAEQPVRTRPLAFGEVESLTTVEHSPTGQIKVTRHENVFHPDGSQTSNVFGRNESGKWTLNHKWTWRLTSTENQASHRGAEVVDRPAPGH